MLDVHAAEAVAQEVPERGLVVGAHGEVGVSGFRGHRQHAPADAVQDGFTQAGAGGDERGVSRRVGPPGLQRVQLVGGEHRHGVGHRLEIVQQPHVGHADGVAATSAARTRHGTLVSVASPWSTGPATARLSRSRATPR